jgi:glycosyltransferase EpsE
MSLIDIIMGAYNEEKTIARAIDSILNQSMTDWRLLVCDDGSKDHTVEILRQYESKHPDKIVVYENDRNRGLTFSLNRLIGESDAKYIARMDADDVCDSMRLEREFAFLEEHSDYAMVGSAINKFDDEGIFATVKFPEKPQKKDLLWNNPFAHPTIMIRANVLKSLCGYSDLPRTLRCEDYDLWMRLYEIGQKGYNIQDSLLNYYEGKSSYKKRKFKYRLAEARTRLDGYRRNGLMPLGIVYALKPIFVGLVPRSILIKKRKGNSYG